MTNGCYDPHNPFGVKAGQVWESNDPRDTNLEKHVVEIGRTHATCRSGGADGRPVKIRLDRFNHSKRTGYTLKKAAPTG